MTTISFEGNPKHPDGLIEYGGVNIKDAIQILRMHIVGIAGLLVFQDPEDLQNYLNKFAEVSTKSNGDRQTLLYTIITPGDNAPVYDLHGKSLSHAVESDLFFKVSSMNDKLPLSR